MTVYLIYKWEWYARGIKELDSIWNEKQKAEKRMNEIGPSSCDEVEEWEVN